MKGETRRTEIADLVMANGTMSLAELAERFAVSLMTIHRDLQGLEAEGLLRKVRGGATAMPSGQFESDFRYRARIAADEKRLIAQGAARFVEPGNSVMVDDSSTASTLVPFLIERRPLTVVTNNLVLITALSGQHDIELIALGGRFSKKFNGFFGVLTEKALDGLRADVALLSSSAIDGHRAFHQDQDVLEIKRRMMAASVRRYLMVDHQKFERTALHLLSDLAAFDAVVTSDALPAPRAKALRESGIPLQLVSSGS